MRGAHEVILAAAGAGLGVMLAIGPHRVRPPAAVGADAGLTYPQAGPRDFIDDHPPEPMPTATQSIDGRYTYQPLKVEDDAGASLQEGGKRCDAVTFMLHGRPWRSLSNATCSPCVRGCIAIADDEPMLDIGAIVQCIEQACDSHHVTDLRWRGGQPL